MPVFSPHALPVLVGSMPHTDHRRAAELIFAATPQIPSWAQLPVNRQEGMLLQFLDGMPGVTERDGKVYIDAVGDDFDAQFLSFFEEFLTVEDDVAVIDSSRFTLSENVAGGFFAMLERAARQSDIVALKGQVTGPVTFCTTLVDQDGRAVFYNEQLRDAAVKLLAMKARWQVRKMAQIKDAPIIFFDEPGLAGFGSSAFITITPADIAGCFTEVFDAVHAEGGLTGVHVCANTEWSVLFDTDVDIVNYDAYSYFDKLLLYPDHLVDFFARGGILASGIVPTNDDFLTDERAETIAERWFAQADELEKLGIDRGTIVAQSLITPSCGTGTLRPELAEKVLSLTGQVSAIIREQSA